MQCKHGHRRLWRRQVLVWTVICPEPSLYAGALRVSYRISRNEGLLLMHRSPEAPRGKRFSRAGLSASRNERLYHSTAILLPDGSLLISGSNPNKDVTTVKWGTSYVVERWYPSWYSSVRPQPTSDWPLSLTYVSCPSIIDQQKRQQLTPLGWCSLEPQLHPDCQI